MLERILATQSGARQALQLEMSPVCLWCPCISLATWILTLIEGNVGKTASAATGGVGKTVGDTTGALGKGDVGGVAAGATGGVSCFAPELKERHTNISSY